MKKILPDELDININQPKAELTLYVPDDLFWFNGHFPSQPLLPGVVQLNWVMHYSQCLLGMSSSIESIDVIKFQIPILPNDRLLLQLNWHEEQHKLQFSYTVAHKVASSGKLKLCL